MAARLRKIYRFPSVSHDDDDPEMLDEEEQEKLIAKLRQENEDRNDEFKRMFLAVPTISTMTFLPALLTSSLFQAKILCLLSMSSLLCTAYVLIFVPKDKPDASNREPAQQIQQPRSGPVRRYINYLNGGLSMLILLNALTLKERRGVHEGFWLLCILPAVAFSVIMMARRTMLDVDISKLEDLRYEYKGA
ncbi:hypothetical protein MMC07_000304 [Pseudocyphellaria aurata]|nr:hypothetical protein [Pseudocyphellaria aurata]